MAKSVSLPMAGAESPTLRRPSGRALAAAVILAALALVPLLATASGQPVWLTLFSRIMIFGLAALGLNLILGFGALVSFGHALYLGIGAYAVGMLSAHGFSSGWAHLGAALVVGGVASGLIGAVCLRTGGLAFIMITLAFAQMVYYVAIGLKAYGGDDGLPIGQRSDFGPLDLSDANVLYYVIFAVLVTTLALLHRLVHARFGMVLQGAKSNARRMAALGFPLLRYRLVAYVISAEICVIAGLLMANLTRFASPSIMQWSVSGELIVMAVLGGVGTLMGPVVGASVWLLLEEFLTGLRWELPWGLDALIRDHWMLGFGLFIVVATLTLRQGLYGMLGEGRKP